MRLPITAARGTWNGGGECLARRKRRIEGGCGFEQRCEDEHYVVEVRLSITDD